MLVKAAIFKDGIIYQDWRHHLIIQSQPQGFFKGSNCIQGFVTDTGEFLDRKQSLKVAFSCGQIKESIGSVLTSEELWDINGVPNSK